MGFKNEEVIKDMIVSGHKRGACDSGGASVKTSSGFIAKPRIGYGSVVKTYVCRNGKVVLKNG